MSTPTLDPLIRADRPDGEPDGEPVRPYDFARPRAVSARQLRTAEAVHAGLAVSLAEALSEFAGEPVGVRTRSLDEVQAVDFERSRSQPAALFVAALGDGGPGLALDVAPALALFVVERHLGGADPLGDQPRALSDLERAVVERHWLPTLWARFAGAWGSVPPRHARFAADPRLLVLAAPDDRVLVADLEVTVGDGSAVLSLCYPTAALQLLLGAPDARPEACSDAGGALDALPLVLRAELGRTRLTVGELRSLEPGDVVPLGVAPDAPVPVWVGDRFRFEARAGAAGTRLALEVLTPPSPPPTHD